MKRGHSNARIDETAPWPYCDDVALIPISGGANVATCRELPPLVLRKAEWEEIGRRMGWTAAASDPDGVKTIIHSLQQFRQMSGGVVCEMDTSRGRLVSHQHDERTDLHALAGEILAENGGSPTERFAFDSELPEWATGSRKTPANPDGVDVEALE